MVLTQILNGSSQVLVKVVPVFCANLRARCTPSLRSCASPCSSCLAVALVAVMMSQ